jgi:hypothetical protein
MALSQGQWIAAIQHLTVFTGRTPSQMPVIHLIYALCFAKLKLWQAARDHLGYALEIAEKANDASLLPVIYGSLAGLVHGKNGHYSALPKMLLLKGLALLYTQAQEGKPQSHIENRSGTFLGSLIQTVWQQAAALDCGVDPRSMPQRSKQLKALEEWEDELDGILLTVERAIENKLSCRTDGTTYDGGRLRRELTKEAEHIIFSYETPSMPHFGHQQWPTLVSQTTVRG